MGKTIEWPKAVESISAEGTKTYYVGDTLDISDLKVVLNLADGSTRQTMPDEYNVVPRVFTSANQEVTVLYRWGDQSFTTAVTGLTVNALEVTSVDIKSDFKKKVYKVGETFSKEGFSLLVRYNNGNFNITSEGITYSEPDMSVIGTKTITVTYGGQTITSEIEVEEIKAIALLINNPPKTDYKWGDTLDHSDAEIIAIFEDGNQRDVTADCGFVFNTGGTTAKQGTTSIIITYGTFEKPVAVTSEPKGIISPPSISISEGDLLTTTFSDENVKAYQIYIDGVKRSEGMVFDLVVYDHLSSFRLGAGVHEIYVKGVAPNYIDSDASNIVEYQVVLSLVGGTIFYEDTTADGVYKLYDENLDETDVLSEAKYYEVITPGTKDRYYVYDSATGLVNDKQWGYYDILTGATTDAIGSGKTNTNAILAIEDTSSYSSNSIFTYLKNTQNAGTGVAGCNDWFVGSKAEQDKLRESGLVDFYTDKASWSSVEYSATYAYYWNGSTWNGSIKNDSKSVVFLRAF